MDFFRMTGEQALRMITLCLDMPTAGDGLS
jgi:hypothetical protein